MTHINITAPLPLSSTIPGGTYNPASARAKYLANTELVAQNYQYEKFIGKRRHNGNRNVAKLTPEHKQYITAFLKGMKIVEIADYFTVSFLTVHRILADPLARELINEFDEGFKEEFRRLFPLVTDSIRDGLLDDNLGIRLKAVDRFSKMSLLVDGEAEGDSDDKIKAVFAARTKFVQMIKGVSGETQITETETEVKVTV